MTPNNAIRHRRTSVVVHRPGRPPMRLCPSDARRCDICGYVMPSGPRPEQAAAVARALGPLAPDTEDCGQVCASCAADLEAAGR
jgi:hypothetical protein